MAFVGFYLTFLRDLVAIIGTELPHDLFLPGNVWNTGIKKKYIFDFIYIDYFMDKM